MYGLYSETQKRKYQIQMHVRGLRFAIFFARKLPYYLLLGCYLNLFERVVVMGKNGCQNSDVVKDGKCFTGKLSIYNQKLDM